MNVEAAPQDTRMDSVKLAAALALVLAALGAFYYFSTFSFLLRVLGILAAFAAGIALTLKTDMGRQVAGFFRDSQIEVRKVVWPTRQETLQTTMLVIGVVVAVAIFLWTLDLILGRLVRLLTGHGV
jgi:preprotein translocase subunit SecE